MMNWRDLPARRSVARRFGAAALVAETIVEPDLDGIGAEAVAGGVKLGGKPGTITLS